MAHLHKVPAMQNNVICDHLLRQTQDAEFLCINDCYEKLHRPNFYDIGGTYIDNVPQYWFLSKTEIHTNIFLLHIFVINHNTGSFHVALSSGSSITPSKGDICFLSCCLKEYCFADMHEKSNSYIATYSFDKYDMELLRNKKLYIYVAFNKQQCKPDKINIQCDFSALLTYPIDSDFTIESEDGKLFKVNKALLAAFSDYFKAMFNENTVESQNNFVKAVGVNADDLKNILEFIYTGTVDNLQNSNCFNLLLLADSYNLKGLFELIQSTLALQINEENVIEVLSLADMCNSEFLKCSAFKFIYKNASTLDKDLFKEIDNLSLTKELCGYLCFSQ